MVSRRRCNLRAVLLSLATACTYAAPSPAPASAPVLLPANPGSTCTREALTAVTSHPSQCGAALYDPWSRKYSAGAPCCSRLGAAYGAKSTAPTKGCFCVPQYWQTVNKTSVGGNIAFASLLDSCAKLNSSWSVPYYQGAGVGVCAGKTAKTTTAAAKTGVTAATASKPRSAGAWFAGLRHDWLVLVSFMSSLVAENLNKSLWIPAHRLAIHT
ncbi:hypothetical protein WJX84_003879 [Apatococcus fuscideae]|uniref:Uncharacterized protein n=1 Tax=Apatococcus fuscideae TaxID=2026836 RepID=A0AAW1T358_9CHLO